MKFNKICSTLACNILNFKVGDAITCVAEGSSKTSPEQKIGEKSIIMGIDTIHNWKFLTTNKGVHFAQCFKKDLER